MAFVYETEPDDAQGLLDVPGTDSLIDVLDNGLSGGEHRCPFSHLYGHNHSIELPDCFYNLVMGAVL